jgi:hypothetical protein
MTATRSTEGSGPTVGVLYPGYHRPLVMAQNIGYNPVLSSGKKDGNHIPRTGYGPTTHD